jgi:hypothetical protein
MARPIIGCPQPPAGPPSLRGCVALYARSVLPDVGRSNPTGSGRPGPCADLNRSHTATDRSTPQRQCAAEAKRTFHLFFTHTTLNSGADLTTALSGARRTNRKMVQLSTLHSVVPRIEHATSSAMALYPKCRPSLKLNEGTRADRSSA